MRSRIWWTLPSARIRPWLISRMFDVIDSISCRMWLETMMLLPARPQSRMRRMVLRRPIGSMPASGSSRMSSCGSWTSACASLIALPHALAVGADLLVGGLHQIDRGNRLAGRFVGFLVAQAVQPHERADPLEAGHALVEGVLLGAEPDLEIEVRVPPDRLAEDLDVPLARLELTGDQLHERRLAGAVGAEEPGDAGRHGDGDVVQADDLAVPLRDVLGGDDRRHVTTSTPRTRRSSTEMETTTRPMMTSAETCHGVA